MQFAIDLPLFGSLSNPHLAAELAHEAEEAGWDGLFVWDHLTYHQPGLPKPVGAADPWILLTAIALRTREMKLGPMVTPFWIAGNWPHKKPFRRAALFDGVFPQKSGSDLTPEDVRELLGFIQAHRTSTIPFDVVAFGLTGRKDLVKEASQVASFAEAGAT
jgi:hypothetical protein